MQMANKISNIDGLGKVLMPYIEKAMKMTRDVIFEIISQKVIDYYNEPVFSPPGRTEPDYYDRTGKLMESLSASAVSRDGIILMIALMVVRLMVNMIIGMKL